MTKVLKISLLLLHHRHKQKIPKQTQESFGTDSQVITRNLKYKLWE